jgi:hypothetical protein
MVGDAVRWVRAQVHIPDFLGPYDAEIQQGVRWGDDCVVARFRRQVVEQIVADSEAEWDLDGTPEDVEYLRLNGDRVEIVGHVDDGSDHAPARGRVVDPDADGWYLLGARWFAWRPVSSHIPQPRR